MAIQRTLLDGDTGSKFSSLELLAGEALVARALDPPASAIQIFRTTVTFNMVNGLQRFTVAVPGVTANVWCSLNGETTPPSELAGVQGCWMSGANECIVLVEYQGATSSVEVPITFFWF